MKRVLAIFMLLGFIVFAAHAQTQEAPLANADVVKLCKLGLGDEIVIAKINQAREVNFNVDTDSLIKLKGSGVSKDVIAAMLKRSMAPQNNAVVPPPSYARAEFPLDVTLTIKSRDSVITQEHGRTHFVGFRGMGATHMTYLGARARSRTSEKLPTMLFRLDFSPIDRAFLVKLEMDQKPDNRSFRFVNRRKNIFVRDHEPGPDDEAIIPCDATEVTPGHWKLTPKKDLAPGEYGLYFHTLLWAFGVDPA